MNWGASAAVADPSRLVYVLYRCLKILENIHYNHLLGTLDEEAWEGMIESEANPERRISTLTLLGMDPEEEDAASGSGDASPPASDP